MAISFTYKNPVRFSYAPGFASKGNNGKEGKQGTSGNAMYFVDYDLDNSYVIQLALQKIENNQILSSSNSNTINDRPYKENDLLLSSNGNIYRIVLAEENTAQNYKYNILPLGTLHDIPGVSVAKIVIADISSMMSQYNTVKTPIYNNRTEKTVIGRTDSDTILTDNDKKLHGIWLRIFIFMNISTTIEQDLDSNTTKEEIKRKYIADAKEHYNFHLQILLNNKKSLQGNYSVPIELTAGHTDPSADELYHKFDFYKKLEFNNLEISDITEIYNVDNLKQIVREDLARVGSNISELPNTFFISDAEMDHIHPSGNNIKYTLNAGEDIYWYKTGLGTDIDTISLDEGINIYPFEDDDFNCYSKCVSSKMKYSINNVYELIDNNDISISDFNKYSIGISLTPGYTRDLLQQNIDQGNNDLVEKSIRKIDNEIVSNTRAGDSAYFSSMDENNVKDEIFKFIKNAVTNKFYLITKNKTTKEFETVEIPAEFVTL